VSLATISYIVVPYPSSAPSKVKSVRFHIYGFASVGNSKVSDHGLSESFISDSFDLSEGW